MKTVRATTPCVRLPAWAALQRRLFDLLDEAVHPFLARYTAADGTLIVADEGAGRKGRLTLYPVSDRP